MLCSERGKVKQHAAFFLALFLPFVRSNAASSWTEHRNKSASHLRTHSLPCSLSPSFPPSFPPSFCKIRAVEVSVLFEAFVCCVFTQGTICWIITAVHQRRAVHLTIYILTHHHHWLCPNPVSHVPSSTSPWFNSTGGQFKGHYIALSSLLMCATWGIESTSANQLLH